MVFQYIRPFTTCIIVAAVLWMGGVGKVWGQVFGTDAVRVQGSKSVSARIDLFANEFIKRNPGKSVVVVGGETEKGVDQFVKRNVELLMMSRRLLPDEAKSAEKAGMKIVENQVGVGSVVFAVNSGNPVSDLTIEQVGKILTGEYTNWNQAGGKDQTIVVLAIDSTDSDTRGFLKDRLTSGKEITSAATTRPIYQALLRTLARTENAIAFARASDVYQLRRSGSKDPIKVLGLRLAEGTQIFHPVTKVEGGHAATYYPLEQTFFLYYDANAKGKLAADFARFCEQQIITNPGEFLDEGVETSAGESGTPKPVTIVEPSN